MKHPYQKISTHPVTGRFVVETVGHEKTKAQEQFKDECDINNIMAKYQKTGEFTGAIRSGGMYSDFSQITDYHDMVNTVTYAQEAFMLLPANIRARFSNDPGQLLSFLQEDSNYDEAVTLGLVTPKQQNLNSPKNSQNAQNSKSAKKGLSGEKIRQTPTSDDNTSTLTSEE